MSTMCHREIIRDAVASLGIAASNSDIRAWAREKHGVAVKNNEIINAVGSQRRRQEHGRTAAQAASVASLVRLCDGDHDLALNLIRLDRSRQRRIPSKERKV